MAFLSVRRVLVIEGLANLVVLILKLSAGLMSGSAAMLADAVHSLVDIVNNGLAFFASKISEAPPDREHPYGHQKFEWLAIFVLATLLSVMAIEVAIRAIERVSQPISDSTTPFLLLLTVLTINVVLAVWQRYCATQLNSELLKADAHHTLGDAFTTLVILGGVFFASRGHYWIDTLLALMVSGLVFYLAFSLFKRAIPVLVDESGIDTEQLERELLNVNGVCEVRRTRSRRVGSDVFADVVVTVSPTLDAARAHDIADEVERYMKDRLAVADVVVHVEPASQTAVAKSGHG